MKQLLLAALIALSPLSLAAQSEPEDGEIEEGFSLMEEGARLMFRGIMREMEPAIEDFEGMAQEIQPALEMLASEMGPALIELMRKLDNVRHYEAPEVLPNGDIIIRRRDDAPPYDPDSPMLEPGEEIEL
ncbi:MAG: hypothetical protein GVY31_10100 [Alphaproteobacteria bacterium]|jgi:hypothetical protein|nr:hypothetical protein [Alphaproteobacteria bacterium]